ncbi:WG repeat-containing protein [Pseudomonas sp. ADAK18]|nr:WG repeat-containing protein [Pseudomonas sp. ADAK18]
MKTAMTRTKLLASSLIVIAVIGGSAYYLMERREDNGLLTGVEYSEEQLNEGSVEDLKALSLPEAKKRLNYLVLDVRDSINRIAMIEGMRLEVSSTKATPADPQEKKELQYEQPFVPFPTQDLQAALVSLKQTPAQFQQLFFDNQSGLKLAVEPIRDVLKRGALPGLQAEERYQVQTVYFRDGTQQPFAEIAVKDSSVDEQEQDTTKAELTLNKPVERISVALTYQSYPGFKKVVLDKAHPKVTADGGEVYQLTALADASASLLLATPKGKTYVIQGLTADGKPLFSGGNSSNSSPTTGQKANLRKYYDELLRMEDNFSSFKSAAAVQDHLEQFAKNLPSTDNDLNNIQAHYRFEDTPESIVIYLLDPAQPQTLTLDMNNSVAAQERYIAYDNKTEKNGFIDKNGIWVVKPRFERVDYSQVPGIYNMVVGEKPLGDGDDDGWRQLITKYFMFTPGTNTLKQLPFDIIEQQINDDLIVVEQITNGPYGVFDIKKQQIVVPMKYVNPEVVGSLFIARPGTKTYQTEAYYGIWSLSGKELLPPRYRSISAKDGFIYTTATDKDQHDVYDLALKKITPPGFTALGVFADDQPLLIQDRKTRKFAFIDTQGKTLPISLPYDQVESFSNGMAVIRKDERYGAIDLTGKVRVPPTYEAINFFQKSLAAVEMEGFDGLVLIDKDNTLVKKLGHRLYSEIKANSNDAMYQVWDAKEENRINVFDADGKQTNSYVRE